jgi:hypothetical protein
MAYLLDRINQQLAKKGFAPRSRDAREWLKTKVKDLRPSAQSLMQNTQRQTIKSIIGKMYFYYYNPKTKDTLPYYDRFPLVIPIELYQDGFLGLNLHYIHPKQRIILLDKLSQYSTDKSFNENTRLQLSYDLLRRASKAYEMSPCIKRYLYTHVESRFLEITAEEWDIAALLPVEQFVGANKSKVWSDSRKKM